MDWFFFYLMDMKVRDLNIPAAGSKGICHSAAITTCMWRFRPLLPIFFTYLEASTGDVRIPLIVSHRVCCAIQSCFFAGSNDQRRLPKAHQRQGCQTRKGRGDCIYLRQNLLQLIGEGSLGGTIFAIHRVEQISPFPSEEVRDIIFHNPQSKRFCGFRMSHRTWVYVIFAENILI